MYILIYSIKHLISQHFINIGIMYNLIVFNRIITTENYKKFKLN